MSDGKNIDKNKVNISEIKHLIKLLLMGLNQLFRKILIKENKEKLTNCKKQIESIIEKINNDLDYEIIITTIKDSLNELFAYIEELEKELQNLNSINNNLNHDKQQEEKNPKNNRGKKI